MATTQDQNKQVTRRVLTELFEEGNFDAAEDLIHPDFVNHEAPPGNPQGPEGLKETIGWLRDDAWPEDVAAAAAKKNVEVIPLQRYAFGRARGNGIVLGFAAVEPRELRRGVEELAALLGA